MRIYTYYNDINFNDQKILLDLWQKSWKDYGFEPVILSESDAKSHPYYDEFVAELESIHLKVLNIPLKSYGLACYLRWLAYASLNIDEPFYVMDYDIMNTGVKISDLSPVPTKLTLFSWCCPCFVSANSTQFNELCHQFVNISNDNIEKSQKSHKKRNVGSFYHDQEFFIFHRDLLDHMYTFINPPRVVNFNLDDDMQNKIVHVSHSSLRRSLASHPNYKYTGDLRTHFINNELNIRLS